MAAAPAVDHQVVVAIAVAVAVRVVAVVHQVAVTVINAT